MLRRLHQAGCLLRRYADDSDDATLRVSASSNNEIEAFDSQRIVYRLLWKL